MFPRRPPTALVRRALLDSHATPRPPGAPIVANQITNSITRMAVAPGIFRQYDIRGIVGRDLTPEAARAIGGAYAAYLREHQAGKRDRVGSIAIGCDNRPSGPELRDALVDGLTKAGADVVDIGVVPTPLNYWSLHHLDVVGGIQITGSHNPPEYNGFKLSVGTSSMHGPEILRLYEIIRAGDGPSGNGSGRSEPACD